LSIGSIQRKSQRAFDSRKILRQADRAVPIPQRPSKPTSCSRRCTTRHARYPNAIKTYEAIVAATRMTPSCCGVARMAASSKTNPTVSAGNCKLPQDSAIFKGPEGLEALPGSGAMPHSTPRLENGDRHHNRIVAFAPQHEEAIKAQFNNAGITRRTRRQGRCEKTVCRLRLKISKSRFGQGCEPPYRSLNNILKTDAPKK